MDSFFPFPPIENDGMSTHSGGSISVAPQTQPLPSPQMGYYQGQHGNGNGNGMLPQQPGQGPWW